MLEISGGRKIVTALKKRHMLIKIRRNRRSHFDGFKRAVRDIMPPATKKCKQNQQLRPKKKLRRTRNCRPRANKSAQHEK